MGLGWKLSRVFLNSPPHEESKIIVEIPIPKCVQEGGIPLTQGRGISRHGEKTHVKVKKRGTPIGKKKAKAGQKIQSVLNCKVFEGGFSFCNSWLNIFKSYRGGRSRYYFVKPSLESREREPKGGLKGGSEGGGANVTWRRKNASSGGGNLLNNQPSLSK